MRRAILLLCFWLLPCSDAGAGIDSWGGTLRCEAVFKQLNDEQIMRGSGYSADRGPLVLLENLLDGLDWIGKHGCASERGIAKELADAFRFFGGRVEKGIVASFPYQCDGNPKKATDRAALMRKSIAAIQVSESLFKRSYQEILRLQSGAAFHLPKRDLSAEDVGSEEDDFVNWRDHVSRCGTDERCKKLADSEFGKIPPAAACDTQNIGDRWYAIMIDFWDYGCNLHASVDRMQSLNTRIAGDFAIEFDLCEGRTRENAALAPHSKQSTITGEIEGEKPGSGLSDANGAGKLPLLAELPTLPPAVAEPAPKEEKPAKRCDDLDSQLQLLRDAGGGSCERFELIPYPRFRCSFPENPLKRVEVSIVDLKSCAFEKAIPNE